jgi:hypothetical protein
MNPYTKNCPYCRSEIYSLPCEGDETTYWKCGTDYVEDWGFARSSDCYESELAEKTNKVDRLRELLALSIAINKKWVPRDYTDYRKVEDIEQEARPAPAPEEPTTEESSAVQPDPVPTQSPTQSPTHAKCVAAKHLGTKLVKLRRDRAISELCDEIQKLKGDYGDRQ